MNLKVETKDKDFSKIPHLLIDSGLLAQLKPSEVKVFLVINRYANYYTGISYPTVKTITELSGVNKNTISKATKALVQKGLIEKVRTPKRFRFRNRYRVTKLKGFYSNLASGIIPRKTDKCRKIFRGKDGKFKPVPKDTDTSIPSSTDRGIPTNTERCTCPQKTDKKKNLEINNRDIVLEKDLEAWTAKDSQASPSGQKKSIREVDPEILNELIKARGVNGAKQYLRDQGYNEEEVKQLRELKAKENDKQNKTA